MDAAKQFQLDQRAAERYEQHVRPIMAPFVETLIDSARVGPSDAVLDLACGTGFVARAASARVGPSGQVIGCDLNPAMLAVAAHIATANGIDVSWQQSNAADVQLDDASIDVVLCQQGLQFMGDLEAVLGEARRVLRPDGRVAATVWAPLERSPYMIAQFESIAEVLDADAVASYRGAFSLDGARLSAAARAAGLRDVDVVEVKRVVSLPPFPAYAADQLSALPWGRLIADSDEHAMERTAAAITRRLEPHRDSDGSVVVPFVSLMLTARR